MQEYLERSQYFIEQSGWLAPLFFIMLHVVRQVLFIPVLLVCLVGGYIFGIFYGSLYSIIGLSLVSMVFYYIIYLFPRFRKKLSRLQHKFVKDTTRLNLAQLMVMRVMPLVHFHLVSLYVIETTKSFRQYSKKSIILSIPPAIIYTAFGGMIHELPLQGTVFFALFLVLLFFGLRKKRTTIEWEAFFQKKD
ncbi:TVP38/TMEM64 family protein [Bacillus suaedae]|uniref:TVP38/TMEM64 family membrane protein n=1 Tax=Halalkalibacter suaedae TaxID=2822140 RepID=A0A941AMB5_9BACI|nr:VTT domain-containing protein [Bacillus suaedae]MBP3949721.1 TVP38/TMEM64 family protein [Bacillus suaedae]